MKNQIIGIVAMDEDYGIGKNNTLPWHLPKDMAFFKRVTGGHAVIMGRKTYESIGKPLPNRINIVVSRKGYNAPSNVIVIDTIEKAAALAKELEVDTYVIGGAEIYVAFLPYFDKLYVTHVVGNQDTFQCDTRLSEDFLLPFSQKTLLAEQEDFTIIQYER